MPQGFGFLVSSIRSDFMGTCSSNIFVSGRVSMRRVSHVLGTSWPSCSVLCSKWPSFPQEERKGETFPKGNCRRPGATSWRDRWGDQEQSSGEEIPHSSLVGKLCVSHEDAEARSPWMESSCMHSQEWAAILGTSIQQRVRQMKIL